MLLTREEMTYDFRGARFDVARDREFLSWTFSQFLYGEVTGIQCGHWLYVAPDFEAANFIARQAVEELGHVRAFRKIFDLLGTEPEKPNPVVRYMSTGMMEGTWEEHVALEMAQGEGFVLMVFYALCDTIDDPEIVQILEAATRQEERHVDFGERWTARSLKERPAIRRRLLGQNLVSLHALRAFAALLRRRLDPEHEVLRQLPAFLKATIDASEKRMLLMRLLDRPLAQLGPVAQALLMAQGLAARAGAPLRRRRPLLTETYLSDPWIAGRGGAAARIDEEEAPAERREGEARGARVTSPGARA